MIPVLLLVGIVLGGLTRHRRSARRVGITVVAVAVAWGLGVAIDEGDVMAGAAAAVLGAANLVVGAVVASSIRTLVRRASSPT